MMTLVTVATAMTGNQNAIAGNGVEVEHLGTNNTLVRVTSDGKYLILPVQESNEEAVP